MAMKPESIQTLLAPMPGRDLTWQQVSQHLGRTVFSDKEAKNRDHAALRQELYRGEGDHHMSEKVIHKVMKDPDTQAKRKEWVPLSKFDNVWRAFVNVKATVYNVPAIRRVEGDANQAKYAEVQRMCRQNAMAKLWNRWGYLQRSLAVGFRVRPRTRKPVIDVISRDSFFALGHPADPTDLIALGTRITGPELEMGDDRSRERWQVWTDHEFFITDGNGRVNPDSVVIHGWERMPWLLFSLEPPVGRLIDHSTGKEIDAAHLSVWFEHTCGLKESKSATKVPIIAGDTTRDARDQAMETEIPIEVRDGTSLTALDMGMDFSQFRDHADFIKTTSAANEGIAPTILKHEGVQSAQARELMRAPLMELRREQEDYLREFEREFVEIQAMVLKRDLSELSFSTKGWAIDFQESSTPLDAKTANEVFEQERRLTLTSTEREIRKRNPDFTDEQAREFMLQNITDETARNEFMRDLQMISGSPGADAPSEDAAPQPGENGDADLRAISGGM
jgi:hypothetical protein